MWGSDETSWSQLGCQTVHMPELLRWTGCRPDRPAMPDTIGAQPDRMWEWSRNVRIDELTNRINLTIRPGDGGGWV